MSCFPFTYTHLSEGTLPLPALVTPGSCYCLVTKRCGLFETPWTTAYQAPLSMGFTRQEYWDELRFPSPGDLPDPGIKPESPASQADSLLLSYHGSPSKPLANLWASLVPQMVKSPRVTQETQVRFLGREDPLEKG